MANITIGGGGTGVFRDAISSALRFTSWDEAAWWNEGGNGFNFSHRSFSTECVNHKTLIDTANEGKFFALPRGAQYKADYQNVAQNEPGFYKYDHATNNCTFIPIDPDDFYAQRNRFNVDEQYLRFAYDESTDRLFLLFGDKTLWEVDLTTGALTQKTTCPISGSIVSLVATGGSIFVIDTSKNFEKYSIAGNSWAAQNTPAGSWSCSATYTRLVTDGTTIIPSSSTAPNSAWDKYNIAGNSWTPMTTTSAPSDATYIRVEIFNGYLYHFYFQNTDNYTNVNRYDISGDTWVQNHFNLRTKGMTNGGATHMYGANGKLYWVGTKERPNADSTLNMQKHVIFEMDAAEAFTDVTATKYEPVPAGWYRYNTTPGSMSEDTMMQKSCGQYQLWSNWHNKVNSMRYIPYIDTNTKTVEWVRCPNVPNKEREWSGHGFSIKNGKLYALDPYTFQLYECTIGTWVWTEKDNLYTRLGNKVPWSLSNGSTSGWTYGAGKSYTSGYNPVQISSNLFTTKDVTDIFLVTPRGSADMGVYVFKYDIAGDQWSLENAADSFPAGTFDFDNTNTSYNFYHNLTVSSNEGCSWINVMWKGYSSTSNRYTQCFFSFDEGTMTFQSRVSQSTTSWYGYYAFTMKGQPIWHTSNSYSKCYFNDMDTMPEDDTSTYLEFALDNQDRYLWQLNAQTKIHAFILDLDNFYNTRDMYCYNNQVLKGLKNYWGWYELVNAAKGGFLIGWQIKDISGQQQYIREGRILVDNDGIISTIAAEALPQTATDSASVFTMKAKKNFKIYLERWMATTSVSSVTFFAPKT